MAKILKEDSKLYQKILAAESYLDKLGLKITYGCVSDGIQIKDKETGEEFVTVDKELAFPRSIETRFRLLSDYD